MTKGTIVLIPFPFTDLSAAKVRPAIVLAQHKNSDDLTLCFLSSNDTLAKRDQFAFLIEPSRQNGLKTPTMARVGKIATISKKLALGELGELSDTDTASINTLLCKFFNLN